MDEVILAAYGSVERYHQKYVFLDSRTSAMKTLLRISQYYIQSTIADNDENNTAKDGVYRVAIWNANEKEPYMCIIRYKIQCMDANRG